MNCRARSLAILFLCLAAPFALADQKAPPETGWVRLPLPEYDRLLRAARRPAEKAPLDVAMTSSTATLEADGGSPRLHTTLELFSLSDKPQILPLPDLGVFYAVDVSGEGASIRAGDSGQLQLELARRGRFTVRVHSVPAREERGGTVVLSWAVPDSPSNRFTATLPSGHENVTLTGGTVSVAADRSGPVRVIGTLRRGETARLSFAVSAARAPEEKLLASASEARLYRLGEKSLGIASRLHIEVLRGTLKTFLVEAAPDLAVTSAWAAGNTVTSFERDPERPSRLILTLAQAVTGGAAEVFWLLERPARPQETADVVLPEIGLPNFLGGETAVAVISPRPLVLDESKGRREGYERIDEADLPAELREMADSTVLLALRRVGAAPPALAVHVSSFPDAVGLTGVIDHGRILTIAAHDGSRIDRWQLELQTRESLVRLPLPPNATLWSLLVDGKPARPLTEQGQLIVSLGRGEKSARVRRIEVVLAMPASFQLAGRGTAHIEMPKLPFPITHTDWDLLLPESSQYRYAAGTVVPMPSPEQAPAAAPVSKGEAQPRDGNRGAAKLYMVEGAGGQGGGRFSGTVADPQGAGLPGVNVTIIRQEGSFQRSGVTDEKGSFLFTAVPPGTYRVVASQPGFNTVERALNFPDGGNVGVDLRLPLSTMNEQVTVTADAAIVDSTKAASASNVTGGLAGSVRQHKEMAKDPNANRQALSDEERASLQRVSEAGVAAIPVDLPTEGKRLHFEASLLIDQAAVLELQVRPFKRGWFR